MKSMCFYWVAHFVSSSQIRKVVRCGILNLARFFELKKKKKNQKNKKNKEREKNKKQNHHLHSHINLNYVV